MNRKIAKITTKTKGENIAQTAPAPSRGNNLSLPPINQNRRIVIPSLEEQKSPEKPKKSIKRQVKKQVQLSGEKPKTVRRKSVLIEELNKIDESDGPEEEGIYQPDSCDSDPAQVEDDVD